MSYGAPDFTQKADVNIIGQTVTVEIKIVGSSINVPIDIVAQSLGNLKIDIAAASIGTLNVDIVGQTVGNIKIDIAAQSVGNIGVDIKAQTVGNIKIDLADVTFTGSIKVDIAAQSIGNIGVDIKAQTIGNIKIDLAAQSLSTIGVDIKAQTLSALKIDITSQSLDTLNVDINLFPWEKITENIIENPGFETGSLDPWYKSGSGVVVVQSDVVYRGSYACKLTPDANSSVRVVSGTLIPVKAGQKIEVIGAMKADANITRSYIRGLFYTSENKYFRAISSESFGGDYDWTFKKFICTVPDGAAYVRIDFMFYSGSTPGNGYVDSVVVARYIPPSLDENLNLNINITAQTVGISIQAEWQAQIGNLKNLYGSITSLTAGSSDYAIDYQVPSGKTLYIYNIVVTVIPVNIGQPLANVNFTLEINHNPATRIMCSPESPTQSLTFNCPLKICDGEYVSIYVTNYDSTHDVVVDVTISGYEI